MTKQWLELAGEAESLAVGASWDRETLLKCAAALREACAENERPMPSPSELRALAERAKRLADAAAIGPWKFTPRKEGGALHSASVWQDSSWGGWCIAMLMMDSDLDDEIKECATVNGEFIAAARTDVPALADAVLSLLQENERLRYSHLPEAVEEPSDLENDFYDSATEGYSSNSRGMEHDDDGT